ncbi:MAG: hypothetical protein WBA16_04530 [Nonlabens sp.]
MRRVQKLAETMAGERQSVGEMMRYELDNDITRWSSFLNPQLYGKRETQGIMMARMCSSGIHTLRKLWTT